MSRREHPVIARDAARQIDVADLERRDRPFQPWRRPASERAEELVRWAVRVFEEREALRAPRDRRRRPRDQEVMEATVAALVCDAIHRELTEPGGRVMLSLSNQKLG